MKAVILAAGEGVRMRPLTNNVPKPMLLVDSKPLLEHIIDALPGEVNRLVLVVGYLHQKIHDYFKHHFGRFKIDYIVQNGKLGTYHALELSKNYLKDGEKFLVLYADDLHGKEGLAKCVSSEHPCLVVSEAIDPCKFGVVELNQDNSIKAIEEKPENPKSNLVSTGVLLLNKSIFNYPAKQHQNGEYYLTDSLAQMLNDSHRIMAVKSDFWLPIGYPGDLEKAEQILSHK